MAQAQSVPSASAAMPDLLTLIAISVLAHIGATALHEHLGHSLACVLLGGHINEAGAFYVDCAHTGMSDLSIRLVALAGPVVSLLTGIACFLILRNLAPQASVGRYFTWILGTAGLMSFTGYLLFSGVSGLGDFGTGPDGAIRQLQPEALWRLGLTILGIGGYYLVVRFSVRELGKWIGGGGVARIRYARNLALVTYLSGAAAAILIGMLNPLGVVILLTSAAASSLGANSGFLWMMQLLDRKEEPAGPYLTWGRRWVWIVVAVSFTIAYALILGPSIRAGTPAP